MSFCSNVKAELARQPIHTCCAVAEAYGVLLFCNTFTPGCIKIVTESKDLAQRLPKLFKKAFDVEFDQLPDLNQGKSIFVIDRPQKLAAIYETFGLDAQSTVSLHVNLSVLEEEHCRISFVRGAFMAGGSVTDPEKRYHLELATSHHYVSREVYSLLMELGFYPKDTTRGGNSILYFKQSDHIEDLLTTLGAPVCAMQIMEAKVEKEFRNKINRWVNCETANVDKTVNAAQEQLAAIRRLEQLELYEQLPQKLRETAELRKAYPEATLQELAQMQDPPLTKSAINHRMRKIMELSRG